MVVDSETGYLVAAGDEDAFLDRLQKLRSDDSLRSTMGAAGRRRVADRFTRRRMVSETARILARHAAHQGGA
jgi:glycosyltransferase involved in cell wall biosynthesis